MEQDNCAKRSDKAVPALQKCALGV